MPIALAHAKYWGVVLGAQVPLITVLVVLGIICLILAIIYFLRRA